VALCCERETSKAADFQPEQYTMCIDGHMVQARVLTHETAKEVELGPYCVTALLPLRPLVFKDRRRSWNRLKQEARVIVVARMWWAVLGLICSCHTARTRAMRQTPSSSSLSKTGGCTLKTWKSTLKAQMALANMVQAVPPLP
jgi:hypothetical protein